jgi:hypothetical protein
VPKKDLLKARREGERISPADIIQNEIRNPGKTVDIRTLINTQKKERQ